MSAYHLPPPTDHRSQPPKSPPAGNRRPLTPSSLRDVNPPNINATRNFNYPSPPTGHDLMAMFPPNPPPALLPGPTSGYFHSQERAFFSRAGDNSMFRVQIDIDMPMQDSNKGKARAVPSRQRSSVSPPHAGGPHRNNNPQHRSQTIPINPVPVHAQPAKMHMTNHIPPEIKPNPAESTMVIINDGDDAWKRPTPYSERRRGKGQKRRSD